MVRYYIKKVDIEGFRGINNEGDPLCLKFNTQGVTSFFAENGQGKSSIYEALFYCINDKFPKIDRLHRDLRDYNTITNLFHKGDGKISLIFCDDANHEIKIDYNISRDAQKRISSLDVSDPIDFLKKLRNEHNFLDYSTFTQIINDSPEDAGKTFSALVGFSKFSELKDKLDALSRTQNINTDYDKKNKEKTILTKRDSIYNTRIDILRQLDDINLKYKKFNKTIIEKRILIELKKLFPFINLGNIYEIDYDSLLARLLGDKYDEDIKRQSNLLDLCNSYKTMVGQLRKINKSTFRKIASILINAYKNLDDIKDIYLGSLYEKAINTYNSFNDIDKNTCLLCNTDKLGTSELTFYDIITLKISKYQNFRKIYDSFYIKFKEIINKFSLIEIENILLKDEKLTSKDALFTVYYHTSNEILPSDFFSVNDLFLITRNYLNHFTSRLKTLQRKYSDISIKIPKNITILNNKISIFKNLRDKLKYLSDTSEEIVKTEKQLENINKWHSYIEIISNSFDQAYSSLIEEIAEDINKDSKLFFSEIMCNNEIVPLLEKKSSGQKLDLLLERFYASNNQKAANLLCESNRNAYCLSIYFATALKNRTKSKFLILDDITSSFDSGHQIKLLELIENYISKVNFKRGRQVILFTHDGELKKILNNKNNKKNGWNHFKIFRTIDGSRVSIKEIHPDYQKTELIQKLNNGDTEIGNLLREFFEKIIFEIIEELNLPIPYRDIYDLGQSKLESLINSIERHILVENHYPGKRVIISIPSTEYFKTIKDVSNKISHFATSSKVSYTPAILLQFVKDIEYFQRLFQYNCTCHLKQGWVYYKSIYNKKINKECKC